MTSAARTATVLGIALAATVGVTAQKLQTRSTFIEAVDAAGVPVTDLKPADLELSEGTNKRQIVKTQLGTAPMRIAFLVDTSDPAEKLIGEMRSALNGFMAAYTGPDEFALTAIGRQPRVVLKPTTDRAKIKKAIDGLFKDGGATCVLDGVRDTFDQIMKQPEVHWPVFVIITTATNDGSAKIRDFEYTQFIDNLRGKGATVHAIAVQDRQLGTAVEYAQDFVKYTGGWLELIGTSNVLADKLKTLGTRIAVDHERMATRYSVEFLGDPKSTGQVSVASLRQGVKVSKVSNTRPF